MRYDVGQYIILNRIADSGQWDNVIGLVDSITVRARTFYKIYPITLPYVDGRSYTRERILELHSFNEEWVKNKQSDLLNCLFERGV